MVTEHLDAAEGLLSEFVAALREPASVTAGDELVDALKMCRELRQLVDQAEVEIVSALDRDGVFAAHGYKKNRPPRSRTCSASNAPWPTRS